MSTDNGILPQVPGHIIGGTLSGLPPAGTATEPTVSREVPAGDLGMVRITYERMKLGAHKSRYWAWVPVRAEAVPGTAPT